MYIENSPELGGLDGFKKWKKKFKKITRPITKITHPITKIVRPITKIVRPITRPVTRPIKKVARKVLPIAAPIVGGFFGPIGMAAGSLVGAAAAKGAADHKAKIAEARTNAEIAATEEQIRQINAQGAPLTASAGAGMAYAQNNAQNSASAPQGAPKKDLLPMILAAVAAVSLFK